MISVTEARNIIQNNVQPLPPVMLPLQHAAQLLLAEDVYAAVDVPSFDQSAMDGYACSFDDIAPGKPLQIVGEVPAGDPKYFSNLSKKAVRIFTGAPVPPLADTVIMQEKTTVQRNALYIHDDQLVKGKNVRLRGSEIRSKDLALKAGTNLSPAAIGFIAGMGVAQVLVFPKPSITVIVTGKELQQPGEQLHSGQVYESNSFTLHAALKQLHFHNIHIQMVDDDLSLLQQTLSDALLQSDMVLLTGGVSVGDYDFVLQAALLCGVEQRFHKVKQRPGKPLFFGMKHDKVVFGLPGNPSSVLTCFYEYVLPALEKMTGSKHILTAVRKRLSKPYTKAEGLTHFLKATINGDQVIPLPAQESYRLSSFATADCLICLEEDRSEYLEGDEVEVHLLPS